MVAASEASVPVIPVVPGLPVAGGITSTNISTMELEGQQAPMMATTRRAWSSSLCDCFSDCCSCWMGLCCFPIVVGQLWVAVMSHVLLFKSRKITCVTIAMLSFLFFGAAMSVQFLVPPWNVRDTVEAVFVASTPPNFQQFYACKRKADQFTLHVKVRDGDFPGQAFRVQESECSTCGWHHVVIPAGVPPGMYFVVYTNGTDHEYAKHAFDLCAEELVASGSGLFVRPLRTFVTCLNGVRLNKAAHVSIDLQALSASRHACGEAFDREEEQILLAESASQGASGRSRTWRRRLFWLKVIPPQGWVIILLVLSILPLCFIRRLIRERDHIRGDCCENPGEDFFCAFCCTYCVACQLMRHENMTGGKYNFCSSTGGSHEV